MCSPTTVSTIVSFKSSDFQVLSDSPFFFFSSWYKGAFSFSFRLSYHSPGTPQILPFVFCGNTVMFKFKDILFLCLSSVAVLGLCMKRLTLTLGLAACKSVPQLLQLVVSKAHAHMHIFHPACTEDTFLPFY